MVKYLDHCDDDMVISGFARVSDKNGKIIPTYYVNADYEVTHSFEEANMKQDIYMQGISFKTSILKEIDLEITKHCFYTDIEYILSIYYSTTGMWWEMRYRSIVETIANLVLNLLLGYYYGINGIILATVISLLIFNFFWGSSIVFNNYFGLNKLKKYFLYHLKYLFITISVCDINWIIKTWIHSKSVLIELILKFVICLLIPGILYFAMYCKQSRLVSTRLYLLSVRISKKNLKKL